MDARSPGLPPDSLPAALTSAAGWRADAAAGVQRSLPEVYGSISVPLGGQWWRRLLAFAGPGYLVSVGYMDPGNWATDLAGGSKFGYTLLSVILISNLMAILLQALAARLGIVTDRDLAQACRAGRFPAAALDEQGLSLSRSVRHRAFDRDRGLFCDPDRRRRSAGRRDAAGVCAVHRDLYQSRDALHRHRHHRGDGDAA